VEGHQVKFFPLPAGQAVKNLAVYLHGDLAGEWYDSSAFPEIVDWAQPKGILVLGILSLAVGNDGLPRWGHAQTEHAEKAARTIEAFLDAYGASREKIFYWGVSGGSWFMTSSFIAHVGHRVPGIFAASCGGSGESWGWAWDPASDTTTRSRIALLLNYGSEDFLAEDEAGSVQDFKARGFSVEEKVYPGAGHCQHAIDEPTLTFWSKHL
jgi:pimeloyl-ACP methyl ester carboxylesterase